MREFDDFDLYETAEEYYDMSEPEMRRQKVLDSFQFFLTDENRMELETLFGESEVQ
jgi:hypothetical protein